MKVMDIIRGREPENVGVQLHQTVSRESLRHEVQHGVLVIIDPAGVQGRIGELVAANRHQTNETIAGLVMAMIRREARGI